MSPRLRARLCAFLLLSAPVLPWSPAGTAAAHPFGEPQQVHLATTDDPTTVRLTWSAAPDDYTALAMATGVVSGQRRMVFTDGASVPEQVDAADADALAQAPALADYLLPRLVVRQAGEECSGALLPVDDLTADGAVLEFTCPRRVSVVEVEVRTLVDLHPAYRTLARTEGDATAVLTLDAPSHTFRLGEEGGSDLAGEGRRLVVTAGLGGIAAVGLLFGVRRMRGARRRVSA